MFSGPFDASIIKRAQDKNLVKINIHNLRNWTKDKHKTVDDRPYGGGTGMILMVEPVYLALQDLKPPTGRPDLKVILLSPSAKPFNQKKARELSKLNHLILIAGHYEGYDERIRKFVDEEISIGDYILTGGELPAMIITDSVVRLISGVIEKPEATLNESFEPLAIRAPARTRASASESLIRAPARTRASASESLTGHKPYTMLEFPQYTRPENFKGHKVPEVLLSGNHAEIAKWRKNESLKRTKTRRPDLLRNNQTIEKLDN